MRFYMTQVYVNYSFAKFYLSLILPVSVGKSIEVAMLK